MIKKLFLAFLIVIALGAVTTTVLVKFFGLRVEALGQGYKPHFYFFKPEEHLAAIEKSRAEQRAATPPATETATPPITTQPTAAPLATPASEKPLPETPVSEKPAATAAAPLYWTSFRGPHRDGHYDETKVLTAWPAQGLTRLWKQPIGLGYSSFAVARGIAYTLEQRRDKEVAGAYDIKTGRELWTQSWPALFAETLGGDGPRATPVWDDGRVYALGATGEFHCLDATTGKTIWAKNILTENRATNLQWGVAGSPLIVDGMVVVQPGGAGGKSVVAYDKRTGKTLWTSLDDPQSYSSPTLATIDGARQIVSVSQKRVVGLNLTDGKLLWEYPWYTSPETNSTEPVFLNDHQFFLSSGYGHGSVVLDVSHAGDAYSVKPVWQNNKLKTRFNTAVYSNGYLYGLDEGILACVDAKTGDLKWKGGRYGYGQLVLASGHIIVLTEDGDLVLVRASPEKLEELSRFTAIEGKTWTYPAIDDGIILVRNNTEMAAFKIL